jgi:hypothetical protein
LKVYNHEKQTLKKQFDGYKKARSKTWKVNGLNSQLPNEKTNNRGANYETHKQFNQRKSSLYDENGRRLCAEEQVIRATGNHNNDIRIFDQSGRAVSESEYFGF